MKRCCKVHLLFAMLLAVRAHAAEVPTPGAVELRRYEAPEAGQGVAVDSEHFYAIGNRVVAKYSKETGKLVKRWTATPEFPLVHLNSGVVRGGKLYCAHSNFPHYPEASSVEVWDTDTLQHIGSVSLGIYEGSLTWIDWRDDGWWAVFAHYTERVNDDPHAKDARWTSLVRFDRQWRRTGGWVFPPQVLEQFEPHSCSGGSWSEDGGLYCTGHDRRELYELALPRAGAELRLLRTVPAPLTGQGFAWDRTRPGVLFGIDRGRRQVIAIEIPTSAPGSAPSLAAE